MRFSSHSTTVGLVFCSLFPALAQAETVACHTTYGGETKQLIVHPTSAPYAVKSIAVGSYFRFRVVFRNRPADTAAIRIYAFADQDDGPALIHQATYPYPPARGNAGPFGFSGQHFVYEPESGAELQYWCEWRPETRPENRSRERGAR